MKKLLSVFALVFLLTSFLVVPAQAVEISHTNDTKQPSSSNWCWACCDYVILDHYASNGPSMQAIVHWVNFGNLQCNPDNDCPYDAPQSRSGTPTEARNAINHWGVTTSLRSDVLSWTGLRSQINNGSMVWCRFAPTSGMGHAELAVGYSSGLLGDKVIYFEPMDGDDHTTSWSNYSSGDFLNSSWNWTHSIFDLS